MKFILIVFLTFAVFGCDLKQKSINNHSDAMDQVLEPSNACRCEGDGPCSLDPTSKGDLGEFKIISTRKSKDRAYKLIEVLSYKGTQFEVIQGGCAHPFVEFKFKFPKESHSEGKLKTLNALAKFFLDIPLPALAEKAKDLKKRLVKFSEEKDLGDQCFQHQADSWECLITDDMGFSTLGIGIRVGKEEKTVKFYESLDL